MTTQTSDQWVITIGRSKIETPTRKFLHESIRSAAVLQHRREFIPLGTLNLILAVVGLEQSQSLITFGPERTNLL